MICDVIRSCYESNIRPFTDSDQEYVIRWYPAPEQAKIMPDHHLYASSNWVRDKTIPDLGPGEVTQNQKVFVTGRNPPCYLGQCRVGSDEAWQHGLSIDAMDEPAEDLPECCSVLPCPFVGLSLLGATTFLYYNIPPVAVCPWMRGKFTIAGVTNNACTDCDNLNGEWVLSRTNPRDPTFNGTDSLAVCGASFTWQLRQNLIGHQWELMAGTIGRLASYSGEWDQCSPLTMLVGSLFDTDCNNVPLTITIEEG